jgi:hypothetical protein
MKTFTLKPLKWIAVLLLVFAITAHARIGWTLEQCKAAYGPDIAFSKDQGVLGIGYWFENKDKLQVTVVIRNHKVQYIAYRKPSKGEFSQREFNELSAQNCPKARLERSRFQAVLLLRTGYAFCSELTSTTKYSS